jgi:hypothetical protein
MPTKLFRPIGLQELALLWETGMREFSPRVIQQPIFYPVVNLEYARQIARDWYAPDANAGFAGYVTQFNMSSAFLTKYELRTAGSDAHREYWIPAREMPTFNKAINGLLSVEDAFFGPRFSGYIAEDGPLKDQNAAAQYATLSALVDFAAFSAAVSEARKAVFLNCLYWFNADLSVLGGANEQRYLFFTKLGKAWKNHKINAPLPIHFNSD